MAAGRIVIAAPYVHTALGAGVGLGLPEGWLREVLGFAPAPDVLRLAAERKARRGWRPKAARGFGEFCVSALALSPGGCKPRVARSRAREWLAETSAPTAIGRREIVRLLADVPR